MEPIPQESSRRDGNNNFIRLSVENGQEWSKKGEKDHFNKHYEKSPNVIGIQVVNKMYKQHQTIRNNAG